MIKLTHDVEASKMFIENCNRLNEFERGYARASAFYRQCTIDYLTDFFFPTFDCRHSFDIFFPSPKMRFRVILGTREKCRER